MTSVSRRPFVKTCVSSLPRRTIITSDGQKRVKIPLRYLDQYRFKFGQPQEGVGQGPGTTGRRPGTAWRAMANDPGTAWQGDQPGEQTYEVEIPLEELTRMMLEDLALPWLEEKPEQQVTTITYQHHGCAAPWLAGQSRQAPHSAGQPQTQCGPRARRSRATCTMTTCASRSGTCTRRSTANAAVYMLMDRSGSMTTRKKYIAKSFFFWMVRFLAPEISTRGDGLHRP